MIRLAQIGIFILSFTIEVQVKAESFASLPLQAEPILYPANCMLEAGNCGYKTYPARRYLLKISKGELTLGSDTIVIRKDISQYALVSGTLMFNGVDSFTIETPMGTIKTIEASTNVIVEKTEKNYWIKVITGKVEVLPKGAKDSIQVLAAYENQLSGVNEKGVAVTAFPKPINVSEFFQTWAALFNGDKNQFKKAVTEFKSVHNQAVQEISEVYSETSKREIASYKEEMKIREERRKKDLQEKAFLRRMFERRLMGLE